MNQPRSHPRLVRKLQEALGDQLCVALEDATVVEIMLNPDGRLFIERLGHGVAPAGEMSAAAAEVVIGAVAHALQSEVDTEQPIISGELPIGGHRFEGLLPPVVAKPAFTIRRRASRLIPLDDYVRAGVMTEHQASTIRSAVAYRLNVIISGGTGSGKTTLANAVIDEIVKNAPEERLVILEDTAEIQCVGENAIVLHTSDNVDMARLLKSTMRLRPDRIVVGEVRDGAALTLLKAWNTGHPGGVATIHSNTAISALRRLEQLTAEASQQPMHEVIGEAVDLIVSIERTPRGRRVRDIIQVDRFANGVYQSKPTSSRKNRGRAMSRKAAIITVALIAAFSFLSAVAPALASSGGGGLPWEGPLQQIQESITGPVAGAIALAAVAIAGGMLIFGGELNDFARRLVYIALVAGILLGATNIVGLFGATGATIGLPDEQKSEEQKAGGEGPHG
ncbi:P-type conjugative transfer ATPase TrbB [Mycoplana sp. MJR14]|nr:P-type conjugative transfer ATPase TrbB [Mycoplana sp. MJR14]MDF1631141.1 P-type conjugative transfer ATPase TrbB [Mycoplana sp. MJR14]